LNSVAICRTIIDLVLCPVKPRQTLRTKEKPYSMQLIICGRKFRAAVAEENAP
jgi:hypothetical protein